MDVLLPWEKNEGSFTLALDGLGLPVVQCLDEKSTAAMWADGNINYTKQWIIKRHLRMLIMSNFLSLPITMSIGTTKMVTRHRS
jgi:hypothetical protein